MIPVNLKKGVFNQNFKNTGFGLNLSRENLSITGLSFKENGETRERSLVRDHDARGIWRMIEKGA